MYIASFVLLCFNYVHTRHTAIAVHSDILLPTPSGFGNQICKKWPNFALQDINPSSFKRKYLEYYGLSDIDPKPDVTIVGLYYSDDTTCQENVAYQQLLKTEIESKTDWLVSSVVINNYAPINCLMNQNDDKTYCSPSSSSTSSSSSSSAWWWWASSWYAHEDPCYDYIGTCAPGDERLDAKTWIEPFLSSNSVSSSDRKNNNNIALTLPIFQDTEWSDVWDGFGGSLGDLFIYDAYGWLYEYYCGNESLEYYTISAASSSGSTSRCKKSISKGGLKVDKNYLDVMSSVLAATTSRYSRCADFNSNDDDDDGGSGNHNADGISSTPVKSPIIVSSSSTTGNSKTTTTTMSPSQTSATAVSISTTGGKGKNSGDNSSNKKNDKDTSKNDGDNNNNSIVSSLKKTYSRYRKHRDSLLQTSSKSSNNKTTTSHHWSGGALLASVLSFCILASAAIYLFLRWRKSRVMMAQFQFLNTRDNMAFTQLPTNDDDDDDVSKDEEHGYDRVSGSSGSKFIGYGARDNIINKINKDVSNNTDDKTKSKSKSTHKNAISSYNDDGDNDYNADNDSSAAALRSSYHYGTPSKQQQQVNNNNNNNNNIIATNTKRGIMNSADGKNSSSSMTSTSDTFYGDDDNDDNNFTYNPVPTPSTATTMSSSSSQHQQQQQYYAPPLSSASKLTPTTSATNISSTKNKAYNSLGTTTDLLNSDNNSSNSYYDNSNNKVNNSIVINGGTDISAGYATL